MTKKKHTPKDGPRIEGGSREARQMASVILEVLSGLLHPTEAAAAMGINPPRYYILERRALEGLVKACEPAPKGPGKSREKIIADLQQQVKRLGNDVLRYQALARAAQRTIGLSPTKLKPKERNAKGHKRRKPQVRALKVCKTLTEEEPKNPEPVEEKGEVNVTAAC
jgi:hypothetical protein